MTKDSSDTNQLSVLRNYLRRRSTKPRRGLWGRLFGSSLSQYLADQALHSGAAYSTVTLGHMGAAAGAKHFVADLCEIPPTTLPTCVELVGLRLAFDAFVEKDCADRASAVLVRLDVFGISITDASTT